MRWTAILVAAAGCYLFKLAGLCVPNQVRDRSLVRRAADLLPVALLSALVGVQTFSAGQSLQLDARLAGVAVGMVALLARAPFLVVVGLAAATAAILRLLAA